MTTTPLSPEAGNIARGRKRRPRCGTPLVGVCLLSVGLCLLLVRHLAERHRQVFA